MCVQDKLTWIDTQKKNGIKVNKLNNSDEKLGSR